MREEDVVVVGLANGAADLVLELLVDDVGGGIALGEDLARCELDEGVQFLLGVVLLGKQRQLQRQPDEARMPPRAGGDAAHRLGQLQVLGEDRQRRVGLAPREPLGDGQPPHKLSAGQHGKLACAVVLLELPQQAVVRNEDLAQQDVPSARRGRLSQRRTAGAQRVVR
ncbi:MAG: hypothetical protein IPF98_23205 [Gemmatimonadetes bacterium]|nr:hypothetical protein [Gemmatimonadota bacterium]